MFASCMENRAQSAARYLELKKRIHRDFLDNPKDVYTLNAHDLTLTWIATHLDRGWSDLQISQRFSELLDDRTLQLTQTGFEVVDAHGATITNALIDAKVMAALGTDMKRSGNVLGAFRISVHNGRQYIIFKGNPRLRSQIRGTRYRLNNPTVVKMGIGNAGLKNAAKGGVFVTVVISAGVNTLSWIFDESFGWRDFLSNMAEDTVKAALAATAGYFAAKAVAATTGFALLSYGTGYFVGLAAGFGLEEIRREDVEQFSEQVAKLYRQSATLLSDPQAYMKYGVLKAEDAAICTVAATGGVVVEAVQKSISDRINELMRRLSPMSIRL